MFEFGRSCLTHYLPTPQGLLSLWVCSQMFNSAWFYLCTKHFRIGDCQRKLKNSIIKWGGDIPALFLQRRRMIMSVTSVWYCIFYTLFWCPCLCFLSGSWISAWEDHSREPSYKLCRTATCTGCHNWSYPKTYTSSSIILSMTRSPIFGKHYSDIYHEELLVSHFVVSSLIWWICAKQTKWHHLY